MNAMSQVGRAIRETESATQDFPWWNENDAIFNGEQTWRTCNFNRSEQGNDRRNSD